MVPTSVSLARSGKRRPLSVSLPFLSVCSSCSRYSGLSVSLTAVCIKGKHFFFVIKEPRPQLWTYLFHASPPLPSYLSLPEHQSSPRLPLSQQASPPASSPWDALLLGQLVAGFSGHLAFHCISVGLDPVPRAICRTCCDSLWLSAMNK